MTSVGTQAPSVNFETSTTTSTMKVEIDPSRLMARPACQLDIMSRHVAVAGDHRGEPGKSAKAVLADRIRMAAVKNCKM
jgi:hypothetical protein